MEIPDGISEQTTGVFDFLREHKAFFLGLVLGLILGGFIFR